MQKDGHWLTVVFQLFANCLRVVFQVSVGLQAAIEVRQDVPDAGRRTPHKTGYHGRVDALLAEEFHEYAARIDYLHRTAARHYHFLGDLGLDGDQGQEFGKDSALTHIVFSIIYVTLPLPID